LGEETGQSACDLAAYRIEHDADRLAGRGRGDLRLPVGRLGGYDREIGKNDIQRVDARFASHDADYVEASLEQNRDRQSGNRGPCRRQDDDVAASLRPGRLHGT
jgi:hypothetical protein